eukprot:CAMPEP_0175185996 /NCGR_PEP_ID=MMETSP0093-20121207/2162_1 /TAXON_ID=311494 /ORGANISM="Alexandrium monilatum, Strain CCMP3105" /LENGTH=485 /DNA_ID=CAMNT_0016478701 /DNA_START=25 /DNA_END=1481 /DNA_ORIENTATION=-
MMRCLPALATSAEGRGQAAEFERVWTIAWRQQSAGKIRCIFLTGQCLFGADPPREHGGLRAARDLRQVPERERAGGASRSDERGRASSRATEAIDKSGNGITWTAGTCCCGLSPATQSLQPRGPNSLRVVDQRVGRQNPVELLLRHLALHGNSEAQEQPRDQRQPAALREEGGTDDERRALRLLLLAPLGVRALPGGGGVGGTLLDAGEADDEVARDAAGQLVAREGDADAPLGRGEDGARLVAREADEPHGRVREGRDGPEGGRHRAVHLRRAEEQLREVAPLRDQARLVVAERHDSGRAGHVAPALRGGQPLSCHLADRRDLRSGCTAGVHAQAPIFAQLHARQPADAVHDGVGLAEEEHHIEGTAAIGPAVLRLDEELPVALSGARAPGLRGLSLDHPNEPGVEVRVTDVLPRAFTCCTSLGSISTKWSCPKRESTCSKNHVTSAPASSQKAHNSTAVQLEPIMQIRRGPAAGSISNRSSGW